MGGESSRRLRGNPSRLGSFACCKEKRHRGRSTEQTAFGNFALPSDTYVQPRRLQRQLRDIDSHLGQPQPAPPGCSWGTRVGTALSLRGILGRLGFHWPNKNPCAGTAPTGNIWCMEGTGSSCTRTGGSPQLDTAVCQFIWIKNQSPVSHRGLGNTRCKRTECFLSRQLSDFPRDLSLLCSGVARILAEQSR